VRGGAPGGTARLAVAAALRRSATTRRKVWDPAWIETKREKGTGGGLPAGTRDARVCRGREKHSEDGATPAQTVAPSWEGGAPRAVTWEVAGTRLRDDSGNLLLRGPAMVARKRRSEAELCCSGAARWTTVGCRKGDGGDEGGSGNGGGALVWTVARPPVERSLGFKPARGTR
jgi:hypothetical protein